MQKRYTIKTVDISERMDLQTVVDRERGQYLGHVTTCLMQDGRTIYAVYPKCHAVGQIVLKRSDDGGLTWSDRLPVPESWTWSLECPTIYRLTDKQGVSRLFVFSGGYPGMMSISEDDGYTWTENTPMDFGGIVFISAIAPLSEAGEYIALFHDEGGFIRGGNETLWEVYAAGEGANRVSRVSTRHWDNDLQAFGEPVKWFIQPESRLGDVWDKVYETRCGEVFADRHFELYAIYTKDGGLTWTKPRVIANHPVARLCEPCLIKSPDGAQLAVILRENARRMNSMLMLSNDNGQTWTEPVELPAALTGDRHTAKYLPDGRLFITFRDMAFSSDTRGDWVGWVGAYEDIVNLREGQYRVLIMRNPGSRDCAYPGLELLPDGTLVTTTYGHWDEGEAPYIVSVRIDIRELDALATAGASST